MKAVVLRGPCKADEMTVSEVPMPDVRPGWVLIKVKAFGINHSEVLLRQFEISQPYINKPIIPGIECVGEVEEAPGTRFHSGDKVMALMGEWEEVLTEVMPNILSCLRVMFSQ